MRGGKHLKVKKTVFPKKAVMLVMAMVLIAAIAIGGTSAYYNETSRSVRNSFKAAEGLSVRINEKFTAGGTVKENVTVTNTGDTTGYIRCAVTFSFRSNDGTVSARIPIAGTDYAVSYGADWLQGTDGFWYYKSPVAAGATTGALIVSCETKDSSEELIVDISAQAIQSTPSAAVNELWSGNPLGIE